MASEIIVQNLKGPASGSNANKVLIPSGQTLDVSSGTLVPSAGAVVQVISATYSTSTTTTSSSTFADTGLTASITPTSSSNKIAVLATIMGAENNTASNGISVRLMRDSTELSEFAKYAGYTRTYITNHPTINYLDSPATTSEITYKVQFKNSTGSGTANVQANSSVSSIILMEIAG